MPKKDLLRLGNPILLQEATPVTDFNTPELDKLIKDLFDTMHEMKGVGIAAPQIGIFKQVTVFGFEGNPRYPYAKPIPDTILINPTVTPLSEEIIEDYEGCLTVPGLRGLVPRYRKIRYCGFNEKGEPFEREVEGFHARVVQHECDHLKGKVFLYRMDKLTTFGFEDQLDAQIEEHRKHLKDAD